MKIISIAFEGPNRSGKGLQIEILSSCFEKEGIPYMIVRGDGSREKNELIESNFSMWWENINPRLHSNNNLNDWNIAACKLAEEVVYCKNNILPEITRKNNSDVGMLLIDRSILSRAVLISEQIRNFTMDDLYPEYFFEQGKVLTVWDVLPDIIFLLNAPKEVLLSRLSKDDPKYNFRKEIIEKKSNWYNHVLSGFPGIIRSKVNIIDATKEPIEIHNEVYDIINNLKL
ncbi:MAG: hypothetical protein PHF54_01000 [Candidatus Pacebacteria bacterium]|nr:hypothetical protein [Candidatus Paceibacterota bacterium]